jgi:hypothetical protein
MIKLWRAVKLQHFLYLKQHLVTCLRQISVSAPDEMWQYIYLLCMYRVKSPFESELYLVRVPGQNSRAQINGLRSALKVERQIFQPD